MPNPSPNPQKIKFAKQVSSTPQSPLAQESFPPASVLQRFSETKKIQNYLFSPNPFAAHVSSLFKKNIHVSPRPHLDEPYTLLTINDGEIAEQATQYGISQSYKQRNRCIQTILACSNGNSESTTAKKANVVFPMGNPGNLQQGLAVVQKAKALAKAKDSRLLIFLGYGYLSENAEFIAECEKDDEIIVVATRAEVMAKLGNKDDSRKTAESVGVPVIPGYHGEKQDIDTLLEQAEIIGYPVMFKVATGGGGNGLFLTETPEELRKNKEIVGDLRVVLEKYLLKPIQIEIQCFSDGKNRVKPIARDTSKQTKRHAKEVEESFIADEAAAEKPYVAKAIEYSKKLDTAVPNDRGARTDEFLVVWDEKTKAWMVYHVETNMRGQVEGPNGLYLLSGGVLDFIELQFFIALGGNIRDYLLSKAPFLDQSLTIDQMFAKIFARSGNKVALEVRLNGLETKFDSSGVLHDEPVQGKITELDLPSNSRTSWVSTALEVGSMVDTFGRSPLLALVALGAKTLQEAYEKMAELLPKLKIGGVPTNLPILKIWVNHALTANQPANTGTYDEILREYRKELEYQQQGLEGLSAEFSPSYQNSVSRQGTFFKQTESPKCSALVRDPNEGLVMDLTREGMKC